MARAHNGNPRCSNGYTHGENSTPQGRKNLKGKTRNAPGEKETYVPLLRWSKFSQPILDALLVTKEYEESEESRMIGIVERVSLSKLSPKFCAAKLQVWEELL